jgi:SAM-dependent methyltransferase
MRIAGAALCCALFTAGSAMTAPSASLPPADRAASWTRYWRHGALHSCSTSFDSNYGGDVRAFWGRACAALPQPARALDIGTGNGPLPRLLIELRPDPATLDIVAVDLADVAPGWIAELPAPQRRRLQFLGGVRAEALPFDAQTIDIAVSQFGFEYTDTIVAAAELRRVLRPGARVGLIVHAADSLIVRQAIEERSHVAWLCGSDGVLAAATDMLEPMSRIGTPAGRAGLQQDAAANAARRAFNTALQALDLRARGSSCPDLLLETQQGIAAALDAAARQGLAAGHEAFETVRIGLADRGLQLQELVDCARSQDAAGALLQPLAPAALESRPVRFDSGELLGWGLLARMPE